MNLRAKGYSRDKAVLEAIEARRSLDTEQVRVLHFPFQYGRRKAQDRLLSLHKRGKINRERTADGYAYYFSRPGALLHTLGVNWCRLWFEKCRRSWETVTHWSYEQDYGILRCDGFAAVKNAATGRHEFYFVEMDRGTNGFDKVEKYCRLYEQDGYAGRWWVEYTDRFPRVLVATTTPGRLENIKGLVKEQNSAGIRFDVRLLDDVKKEVLRVCGG